MQIAVIDDWQEVAEGVVDWTTLRAHDYPADTPTLAARLAPYQVICIMRERTAFDTELLERLPNLKAR